MILHLRRCACHTHIHTHTNTHTHTHTHTPRCNLISTESAAAPPLPKHTWRVPGVSFFYSYTHTSTCVCARAQTQEWVGARVHTHTHARARTHTHRASTDSSSSPHPTYARPFSFSLSFFLFLLFYAGHRQISGRLLGGPGHHRPKFALLPASATNVQVIFFHFYYFFLRTSSLSHVLPASDTNVQVIFFYNIFSGALPVSSFESQSNFFPFILFIFAYFQPQPRLYKYSAVFRASTAHVRAFFCSFFSLLASAAHAQGFFSIFFLFFFLYFQQQARMSKSCILQGVFR
jgi:hypothetical protein